MAKYRKKPVVVEAEQWLGPDSKIDGVREATPDDEQYLAGLVVMWARAVNLHHKWYVIDAPQHFGNVDFLYLGAWVITDKDGRKQLCRPDVFEATYEKVDS